MSALAVVRFLTEDRESILDRNKREVFCIVSMLALLGVFGDLHPVCAGLSLLPLERCGKSLHVVRGEPRPNNYTAVELLARWPSTDYLAELVNEFGYCPSAAFGAMHHVAPMNDRRAVTVNEVLEDSSRDDWQASSKTTLHPAHPYIPASPWNRETTTGGNFHAKTVTREIEKVLPGISNAHANAVFEIMTKRRLAAKVAEHYGVSVKTLYNYKSLLIVSLRERGFVALDPNEKKKKKVFPDRQKNVGGSGEGALADERSIS